MLHKVSVIYDLAHPARNNMGFMYHYVLLFQSSFYCTVNALILNLNFHFT